MTNLKDFGDRVKAAREEAGLTRPQLSGLTGIPTKSLEKIEYGNMDPSSTRLAALAEALSVDERYLLNGSAGAHEKDAPGEDASDHGKNDGDTTGQSTTPLIEQARQHLNRMDDMRQDGFRKSWRSAPKMLETVTDILAEMNLDGLLDLAEERGLYPVGADTVEVHQEADDDDAPDWMAYGYEGLITGNDNKPASKDSAASVALMEAEVAARIIDTAILGRDLYWIRKRDLEQLAYNLDIKGDKPRLLSNSWSSHTALARALRLPCRELAMKEQAPFFFEEDEFETREVA